MPEKKICPLKIHSVDKYCNEHECAWWDEDNECCAVQNIGAILYVLNNLRLDVKQL